MGLPSLSKYTNFLILSVQAGQIQLAPYRMHKGGNQNCILLAGRLASKDEMRIGSFIFFSLEHQMD